MRFAARNRAASRTGRDRAGRGRRDPQRDQNSKDMMVEALYPITGRLTAAAVANAFRDLVADLNERLDRSPVGATLEIQVPVAADRTSRQRAGAPPAAAKLAACCWSSAAPAADRRLGRRRGYGDQSELVSGLIARDHGIRVKRLWRRGGECGRSTSAGSRGSCAARRLSGGGQNAPARWKPEHERELDDAFPRWSRRSTNSRIRARGALADMAERLFLPPAEQGNPPAARPPVSRRRWRSPAGSPAGRSIRAPGRSARSTRRSNRRLPPIRN